ncbi:HAD-IC family P-type ATPase [Actinokineospora auranticolor]|uniref:Ca2+-transporting ATPase n=1 Tax=Actinokineospora auranticolor TaxID=155976 RepID=A0A2S6GQA6_9PSEU|nr:HAD-IC family P-type ATPase [Actinokineospora auranticolor]PPK67350.1 Ca2+-transporting ATPase [Actinokineospora auranticolor]
MTDTLTPLWHTLTPEQALRSQNVNARSGLSSADVAERTRQHGPNTLGEGKAEPRWRAFLRQYADPMQIVLLVAGAVSVYPLSQGGTGLLLILLTLLNAVLGLRQEGKAAAAVAALQKMMIVKAAVRRDGILSEVPAAELVPGDVVSVEAGDVIPADGRLLRAATLEVAESALTGESLPVAKGTDPVSGPDTPLGDRVDMVYMNTNVTRGSGEFVVTSTGQSTEVGHISTMLRAGAAAKTPLTRQLDRLTGQILWIAAAALVVSMVLNLARGNTFTAVFNAAVAFSISAIPTGLPAVVTTILAWGTERLAKAGAIMKQLRSTETLGSTSAINSDKTGTLTLNQMTAVQLVVLGRKYTVEGSGYEAHGRITRVAGKPEVPLDQFLMPMVLASDAVITDGELVGDPTEGALVALAAKGGVDAARTREEYPRVAELPFDAAYKLMATFHRMRDEWGREVIRCFVKGAPDKLLARAATVLDADSGPVPADDEFTQRYLAENQALGEQGLRVLATARKDFDPNRFDAGGDLLGLLDGLEMLALVGIVDPPRPTAKASIEAAKAAGIRVRMITGDHAATATAIASRLGIDGDVTTGAEFDAMDDDEALNRVDDIGVLARVTPENKVRLVELLRRKGHIVAMTGDGVNDAPALKKADIGVAMGITGTEVTKEAAVMVLTDDNFSTIVRAVELGRGLYDNLVRYLRYQMGTLFGFIFSFLGASVVGVLGGVPFLPLQTLWVNFTTGVFQSIGLGYGTPAPDLMRRRPRPPDEPILPRPLLTRLVGVGLIMAIGTLAVIAWTPVPDDVARTMGLVTFSLFNLFFSMTTKDETRTVFTLDTFADKPFAIATAASFASLVLATVFNPLQAFLRTAQLTLPQWLLCTAVALSVVVLSEIRKAFARRSAPAR